MYTLMKFISAHWFAERKVIDLINVFLIAFRLDLILPARLCLFNSLIGGGHLVFLTYVLSFTDGPFGAINSPAYPTAGATKTLPVYFYGPLLYTAITIP